MNDLISIKRHLKLIDELKRHMLGMKQPIHIIRNECLEFDEAYDAREIEKLRNTDISLQKHGKYLYSIWNYMTPESQKYYLFGVMQQTLHFHFENRVVLEHILEALMFSKIGDDSDNMWCMLKNMTSGEQYFFHEWVKFIELSIGEPLLVLGVRTADLLSQLSNSLSDVT